MKLGRAALLAAMVQSPLLLLVLWMTFEDSELLGNPWFASAAFVASALNGIWLARSSRR
jgi:hypothetical protein